MARDYAKQRKPAARNSRSSASKKTTATASPISGWRWYGAGVLTGLFVSLLLYLGSLPANNGGAQPTEVAAAEAAAPKPRFDFYTVLSEPSAEAETPSSRVTNTSRKPVSSDEYYFLQAGSFKQREDADRRRAELLLLGLEPRVEESNSDNGRWFRVFVGPFETNSTMSKARSLTAAQNIDTLVLKRSRG